MATVALSGIITPTNVVTATSTTTLSNKTLVAPALGTPASGVVTNLTGTASININGTVGATTPTTVVATTVQASTTMGVGGATPSASGSGITFPATQSASTNANTLDDYEEGTWTPVFTNASNITSGNAGLGIGGAKYTKIGRSVTAIAWITGTVTTGATATSFRFSLPIDTTGGGYFESGSAFGGSGVAGTVSGDSNTESNVGWGTDITSGAKNFCVTLTYFSA
jgi:hypothetical protein